MSLYIFKLKCRRINLDVRSCSTDAGFSFDNQNMQP